MDMYNVHTYIYTYMYIHTCIPDDIPELIWEDDSTNEIKFHND